MSGRVDMTLGENMSAQDYIKPNRLEPKSGWFNTSADRIESNWVGL